MGPITALWLPVLVAAHFFAGYWLFKSLWMSRVANMMKTRPVQDDSSSSGSAGSAANATIISTNSRKPAAAVSDCILLIDSNPKSTSASSEQLEPSPIKHISLVDMEAATSIRNEQCQAHHHKHNHVVAASTLSGTPATFEWQSIGCSYLVHNNVKVVLQDITGKAVSGEMQALMGPSGAGKSTLMDILAMRKTVGTLEGSLLVDGQLAPESFISKTSYVPQDDNFVPTMTVTEVLNFYASVLLPSNCSLAARSEKVAHVLSAVGLSHALHTLVGGVLPGGLRLRGLSGGERRRLSIAAGTLSSPAVLFLDEPTSGLDSFAALNVMQHVRSLAQHDGQIVIATIHQPRSAIWDMFDRVTLLSSGRLMYHGPRDNLTPWFKSLGYTRSSGEEADWALDLVATGFDKPADFYGTTMRTTRDIAAAAEAFKAHYMEQAASKGTEAVCGSWSLTAQATKSPTAAAEQANKATAKKMLGGAAGHSYATGAVKQFISLFNREILVMTRNPFDLAGRVLTCTYLGLLYGLLFYNTPDNTITGLRNRLNLFYAILQLCMLLPYVSICLYTSDKSFYLADASAKLYRAISYYTAKVVATTPFNAFTILCYVLIVYGMAGLSSTVVHILKFGVVTVLVYLVSIQVLHLCAVIAPNQDLTFCLSISWSVLNIVLSSFFISYNDVSNATSWLTQLRYITTVPFGLEALLINEYGNTTMDCSQGMEPSLVHLAQSALPNLTKAQSSILNNLLKPQANCVVRNDALLEYLQYGRPYAISVAILVGQLGVSHLLTYAALLLTARREKR